MAENNLVFDKTLSFDCGCSFPYCETVDGKRHVDFNLDWNNLRTDCPATFRLLEEGRTKGCFQIESNLGEQTCKAAPIKEIEDISNIIIIMRPGSTESFPTEDNKNTTHHYLERKAEREVPTYFHSCLEPHLKDTYGLMLTQEQMMFIVKDIAGFTAAEADKARKGVAKKQADVVSKVKCLFIEGCKKVGKVTEEEANKIWSWIEAGQRYSFNKCLSPDTTVETPIGIKCLYELKIGDLVLAPDNNFTDKEYVKVTEILDQGYQEVYEITLDSGKTITCTLEHKFLCEDLQIRPLIEILEKNHKILTEEE